MQHFELVSPDGASTALVSTYGARVLSWNFRGREMIFTPASLLGDETASQHGGVPVLFPQFGLFGDGVKHGVVRSVEWQLRDQSADHVSLGTRVSSGYGFFDVQLGVRLADDSLDLSFSVSNVTGDLASFTCGLHTYLRVDDITRVSVSGLQDTGYLDALNGLVPVAPSAAVQEAPASVDRVYVGAPPALALHTSDVVVQLEQRGFNDDPDSGFCDTVVWNPGPQLMHNFTDLAPDDWRHFVCIEAAQIQPPVSLPAGDTWWASQSLRALSP